MRISVDALGGDNAPGEVVAGSVAAARDLPQHSIVLVGNREPVEEHLGPDAPENISVREAKGAIGMHEEPANALRSHPDSSVMVAARMVSDGEAEAMFSAGSTGATVGAALMRIGRLPGCRRPAIATVLPFPSPVLLLDAGATISCRPQDLLNFAILGGVFARRYFGLEEEARVGLINVGEESGKGNDLARETYKLLRDSRALRFAGNVEGHDIGRGAADVLVADGFTGNVVLKTAEGVAGEILGMVREAVTGGFLSKLAAGILRPKLVGVRDRVDPENYGGSFLLGVNGSVVIGHGNSHSRGVRNALVGIASTGEGLMEELQAALASSQADTPAENGG